LKTKGRRGESDHRRADTRLNSANQRLSAPTAETVIVNMTAFGTERKWGLPWINTSSSHSLSFLGKRVWQPGNVSQTVFVALSGFDMSSVSVAMIIMA
jgi:hypothetical protein